MLLVNVTASVENTLGLIFNAIKYNDAIGGQLLPLTSIPNVARKSEFVTVFIEK